jgi:hypothetical protein
MYSIDSRSGMLHINGNNTINKLGASVIEIIATYPGYVQTSYFVVLYITNTVPNKITTTVQSININISPASTGQTNQISCNVYDSNNKNYCSQEVV